MRRSPLYAAIILSGFFYSGCAHTTYNDTRLDNYPPALKKTIMELVDDNRNGKIDTTTENKKLEIILRRLETTKKEASEPESPKPHI